VKHFLVYTLARLALLVVCYAVLAGIWLAVFRDEQGLLIWPFIAAVIVSSLLSLKYLSGPRDRFAATVQARAERASQSFEDRKAREDS
jgi:hypothetical protein